MISAKSVAWIGIVYVYKTELQVRKKSGDKVTTTEKEVEAILVENFDSERKDELAWSTSFLCSQGCTMAESSSSGGKASLLPKDLASFFGPFCTMCKCVYKTSYTVHLGE